MRGSLSLPHLPALSALLYEQGMTLAAGISQSGKDQPLLGVLLSYFFLINFGVSKEGVEI